jgi:tetratricopeptide (TPR) repeat protein
MSASPRPNTALAEVICEAHWTNSEVASAVNRVGTELGLRLRYDDSAVCHWLKGTVPRTRVRPAILEAFRRRLLRPVTIADLGLPVEDEEHNLGLSLTEDPVTALKHLAAADLHRRAFLTHAAYSVLALASVASSGPDALTSLQRTSRAALNPGQRVGLADVQAIRDVTASLTALDERLGGQHGRDTVTTWLSQDVTAMCNGTFTSDAVRAQMFSAAAEVAYLAGWKAHDAGLDPLAQRYYLKAHQLAAAADGPGQSAYVLRILAHHALDIDQPAHCVDIAEEAWRRAVASTSSPRLRAIYAFTAARAHAAAGDSRRAGTWLARGETLTGRDDDAPAPTWVSLGGSPEIRMASQAAKALTTIGRPADAEPLYQLASNRWNPVTHPRVRALALHELGRAQAAQGHLDQAVATWTGAASDLRGAGTNSARARRAIAGIRKAINVPRSRNSPIVKRLRAILDTPS